MKRVTGFGGIFFKAENKTELRKWYQTHLGINSEDWGAVFQSPKSDKSDTYQVWNIFKNESDYFYPSTKGFMINYTVENLDELKETLSNEGIEILGYDNSEYGKFAWIMDPEGNKIELWEPPKSGE